METQVDSLAKRWVSRFPFNATYCKNYEHAGTLEPGKMPDLRVWGYGIRSMPTTLTHVAPLGLWGIWLSRVLYTCRTSGAK